MPAKKPPTPDEGAHERRYRVLSGGIATPNGPVWTGAIVRAAELGDAARVQKLLARGSIEEAPDGAD